MQPPPPSPDDDNEQIFIVGEGDAGRRLDVFLSDRLRAVSRSQLQRLISTHAIQVNGETAKANYKIQPGDLVLVEVPAPRVSHIRPEAIVLDIVFEDQDLVVVNKPKGMVVHPAPGAESGTLVNALLAHCPDLSGIGGVERPGIVHRLDKDTTGLLVVAKNDCRPQRPARPDTEADGDAQVPRRRVGQAAVHPRRRRRADRASPDRPQTDDRGRAGQPDAGTRRRHRTAGAGAAGPLSRSSRPCCRPGVPPDPVHCAFAGYPVVGDPTYGGVRKVSASVLRGPGAGGAQRADRPSARPGAARVLPGLSSPAHRDRLEFEAPPPAEMSN
jgi:23S rRNA pseudouridine1911/1915/1917 synthase